MSDMDKLIGRMTWGAIGLGFLAVIVQLGLLAGLVWVAVHFIAKWW